MTTTTTSDASNLEELKLAMETAHAEHDASMRAFIEASKKLEAAEAKANPKPKARSAKVKLDIETVTLTRDENGRLHVNPNMDATSHGGETETEIICSVLKDIDHHAWRLDTLLRCLEGVSDDLGADFNPTMVGHMISLLDSELWEILKDSRVYSQLLDKGSICDQLAAGGEDEEVPAGHSGDIGIDIELTRADLIKAISSVGAPEIVDIIRAAKSASDLDAMIRKAAQARLI